MDLYLGKGLLQIFPQFPILGCVYAVVPKVSNFHLSPNNKIQIVFSENNKTIFIG